MKLDRKGFLGLMTASAALPIRMALGGEDRVDLFPRRGANERLNLAYSRVHIGLAHPFSVLHISDTHLTAAYPDEPDGIQKMRIERTATFGGHQEEALKDSLDWARQNVDFVIHTGDLIDWHSRANLDLARKYFGNGLSQASALGNHEYLPVPERATKEEQERVKESLRPKLKEPFPFDSKLQSVVKNGINFVTMDNTFGSVTEEQVELFRKEVGKGLPIVLAMHVPIYSENVKLITWRAWERTNRRFEEVRNDGLESWCWPLAQQNDRQTVAFLSDLRRERQLKCILAGHNHCFWEERFSPTAVQYLVGANFLYSGREVLFT